MSFDPKEISHFYSRLVAGVVLLNLLVAAVLAYSFYQGYRQYSESAGNTSRNLAQTLSEGLDNRISKVDIGLQAVKDEIERQLASGRPEAATLRVYMTRMQARLPGVIGLRATDAQGWVTYGVDVPNDVRVSNADRPHYTVHRDKPDVGLYIGKPVLSKINKVWVLNISRRLNYPDGRFAGDVFANIPLTNFNRMFEGVEVGPHSLINLRYSDMSLILRKPGPQDIGSLVGRLDASREFHAVLDAGQMVEGTFFTPTSVDGTARTVSYRKLDAYPLYVTVELAREDYLAEWYAQAGLVAGLALLFALISGGGTWLLGRMWRRQVETTERLAREEEKFHTIADFTYDWEYLEGEDGSVRYMSPSCERITGYAAKEFMADAGLLERIIHPDDRQVFDSCRQSSSNRDLTGGDFRIVRRDGEVRWVSHNCRVVTGPDGSYRGRRVTNRDITERRLYEAEINRLAQAVEQSPIGMCITGADGKLLFTNQAYTRITGHSFGDSYGMNPRELISGVLPDGQYAEISGKLASGKIWNGTVPARRKNGEAIWLRLSASPLYDEMGKVSNYLYLKQDITEQVKAEEALRSSQSELQQLLRNLPVAVVVHGADTAIRYCNPIAQGILGLTEDQLLGRTAMDPHWHFIREDGSDLPLPEYPVNRVLASRQDMPGMVLGVIVKQGAEPRWVYASAFADMDDNDALRQVVVSFMDISQRLEMEAELKRFKEIIERERDFSDSLIDTANAIILVLDTQGRIVRYNSYLEKLSGFPLGEMRGKDWMESFLPEHERTKIKALFASASAGQQTQGNVNAILTRGGEERLVEWYDSPLKDAQGNSIGLLAVGQDITERKRAEEELRRYRDHLEEEVQQRTAALEAAKDKAEAAEQSLRESEAAVRRKLASLLEPEGSLGDLALEDIINVPELQAMMDEFYRLTHVTSAILDIKGKVLVANGWQDICTQFHRRHPESCKHCIESDTVLAKGAEAGTYKLYHCMNNMWDMATPIIIGGEHVGNLFLGQFFFEGEVPDIEIFKQQADRYGFDEKAYLAALARVPTLGRETVDAAMMFCSRLSAAISRLSYSTVKLARALAERDQVAAALISARDAAQAANQAKSAFLANMSHELRTPLNAILGFSGMMRREEGLRERQRESLDIINRSGEHLLALINDVLEVAKIEAGRIRIEEVPFDLGGMVRDVTDMMQMRAEEKGLRLLIDQSSSFPRYIVGDEARLRQVLINLVGNAIKFTAEGGVTVRLGTRANKEAHLLIEVEDTGVGIGEAEQQRIFDPFVQLGEQGTNKGTGLGLTISRQYVQLMGGSIALESTPGRGSLFRLDLPLREADEAAVTATDEVRKGEVAGLAPGQKTYRILIVEDQEENQLLLARLMETIGMPYKIAANGEQAVQLFREWLPHLIWMDRRMPKMNGEEAARAIRSLPEGKEVKIVAVTASAFKEEQEEMLAAGMDGFVRKPYRFSEIYECMERQLDMKFVYAGSEAAEAPAEKLEAGKLAVLPQALRNELREALESLEAERIALALEKVSSVDAQLGHTLSAIAGRYDYPAIIEPLEAISKQEGLL